MEINKFIEKRMKGWKKKLMGNFVKTRLSRSCEWGKNSWAKITDGDVSNALQIDYLDNKYHHITIALLQDLRDSHQRINRVLI